MIKEDVRNRLVAWSKTATSRYPGLRIRFEYSNSRRVYLVSLSPEDVEDMDGFSRFVMAFEDEMEALYGYNAPLFCDNEELFRLSMEAETIVSVGETKAAKKWHFHIEEGFFGAFNSNYAA